jgi:hypothetical protein
MKPKYIAKLAETKCLQRKELISSGETSARQIRVRGCWPAGRAWWRYSRRCGLVWCRLNFVIALAFGYFRYIRTEASLTPEIQT